ncbi:MAG TPA: collagen-binding domain-containing protein [Candidatus Acidoferrum sp.]|nr:collagen-binding domain-containing protein [Candidatus Acidoferrum sp.]
MTNLRLFSSLLLASAAVAVTPSARAQNLIVNSNFATGDLSGWNVAETGSGGLQTDYGVTSGNDGGSKVPNAGNTYGAYFNPAGGTMDLMQTVDLPAAGSYIVSCSVEPVFNDQDTLTIILGGTPVFTTNFQFGMPYTQISVAVSAQPGSQILDFQFTPGSGPMFFDDAGLVAVAAAPTPTPCSLLGSAAAAAVIGLDGARIQNVLAKINGDEYVSQGGSLDNLPPSTINGNVFEFRNRQYSGRGRLEGGLTVNAALLDSVNADALNAAATIAAMTPTQVFGTIRRPTLITGNGGVNVIDINGNITDSLLLSGSAKDVFFINVSGTIDLRGRATLAVADGVTAGAVLYNLTGTGTVEIHVRDVVNGTILAPDYRLDLDGEFNGAVIGGGKNKAINLVQARVNQPACPP